MGREIEGGRDDEGVRMGREREREGGREREKEKIAKKKEGGRQ